MATWSGRRGSAGRNARRAQAGGRRGVVAASRRGEHEKCCTLDGCVCYLETRRALDGDTATKASGRLERQSLCAMEV